MQWTPFFSQTSSSFSSLSLLLLCPFCLCYSSHLTHAFSTFILWCLFFLIVLPNLVCCIFLFNLQLLRDFFSDYRLFARISSFCLLLSSNYICFTSRIYKVFFFPFCFFPAITSSLLWYARAELSSMNLDVALSIMSPLVFLKPCRWGGGYGIWLL